MNEEPFGRLAVINPFRTFDDVVTEANRLPFGLASYALRNRRRRRTRSRRKTRWAVNINHLGLALLATPFGGVKDTARHEGGADAIEALNTKFVSQLECEDRRLHNRAGDQMKRMLMRRHRRGRVVVAGAGCGQVCAALGLRR